MVLSRYRVRTWDVVEESRMRLLGLVRFLRTGEEGGRRTRGITFVLLQASVPRDRT